MSINDPHAVRGAASSDRDRSTDRQPNSNAGRGKQREARTVNYVGLGEGVRYLRVEEVARYLGLSRFTIYDWVRRGRIPCLKAPGRNGAVRIRNDDVLALEVQLRRDVTARDIVMEMFRRAS